MSLRNQENPPRKKDAATATQCASARALRAEGLLGVESLPFALPSALDPIFREQAIAWLIWSGKRGAHLCGHIPADPADLTQSRHRSYAAHARHARPREGAAACKDGGHGHGRTRRNQMVGQGSRPVLLSLSLSQCWQVFKT